MVRVVQRIAASRDVAERRGLEAASWVLYIFATDLPLAEPDATEVSDTTMFNCVVNTH
jgi:hypothetical protein